MNNSVDHIAKFSVSVNNMPIAYVYESFDQCLRCWASIVPTLHQRLLSDELIFHYVASSLIGKLRKAWWYNEKHLYKINHFVADIGAYETQD